MGSPRGPGQRLSSEERAELIRDFVRWKHTPRSVRIRDNLPLSVKGWCEAAGVNRTTHTQWRKKGWIAEFEAAMGFPSEPVGEVSVSKVASAPDLVESPRNRDGDWPRVDAAAARAEAEKLKPPKIGRDEADYLSVKQTLMSNARSGDRAALDLYFKHWGRPFIEAELAARESSFAHLTDAELAAEIVALAPQTLRHALEDATK